MRLGILVIGAMALATSPVRGAAVGPDAGYCAITPAAPLFSLPAIPGDNWAVGASSCVPVGGAQGGPQMGPWTRSGPVRAWKPRPYHTVAAKPKPPELPLVYMPPSAHSCAIAPAGRSVSMAAGPAVFDLLTAGAPPNSTVTLRIDNRTSITITITVNATPADTCAVGSYHAASTTDPDPPLTELLGSGFLTALNGPINLPFSIAGGALIDGASTTTQVTRAWALLEPSSLILLASGLMGFRYLRGRQR